MIAVGLLLFLLALPVGLTGDALEKEFLQVTAGLMVLVGITSVLGGILVFFWRYAP